MEKAGLASGLVVKRRTRVGLRLTVCLVLIEETLESCFLLSRFKPFAVPSILISSEVWHICSFFRVLRELFAPCYHSYLLFGFINYRWWVKRCALRVVFYVLLPRTSDLPSNLIALYYCIPQFLFSDDDIRWKSSISLLSADRYAAAHHFRSSKTT